MRLPNNLHSLFQSNTTRSKIVRNVLWAVIGKVITFLSTLFVGILVARYLGSEQYGLMNYVVSIVTLYSIFSTLALLESPVELSSTARQRIRKQWLEPFRKPVSNDWRSESFNMIDLTLPISTSLSLMGQRYQICMI